MLQKRYAFIVLIVTFCPLFSKKIVQSQLVATSKELVDGRQFVHTYQIIDGVKRQAWAIDGQATDRVTYEEAILEAEKAERRLEREAAYAAQEEELGEKQKVQQGIMKKLLKLNREQCKQQLARLEECKLHPYMVFDEDSLTQEQYEGVQQLLGQAQQLLQDAEPSFSELQATSEECEKFAKGMKKVVRDSMEQAIAQCDDTVMLKKLLALTA